MKRISHSHHIVSSQTRLTTLPLRECKLVFCLVLRRLNVGRIYGSIARDLKFDWPIQVTRIQRALVNEIRLIIFAGIAARKLTNAPAVIFSDTVRSRWFIFTKQIIVI